MGLKQILEKMKLVELEAPATGGAPGSTPATSDASAPRPSRTPIASHPTRPTASPTPARSGSSSSPPPPRAMTGSEALADILERLPPAQIDPRRLPPPAPAATAGGEAATLPIPDFAEVYRAAGVSEPRHGFSAYKVLEILSADDFAGLEPRAKAAALAGFLKMVPGGPVPIRDVIQDAVVRDQALDKFEEFLRGKLAEREREVGRDNTRLQAEIDELTAQHQQRMAANRQRLEAEQARFAAWQARKHLEERKLADAVAPFVEANPVSVTQASLGDAGPVKASRPEG